MANRVQAVNVNSAGRLCLIPLAVMGVTTGESNPCPKAFRSCEILSHYRPTAWSALPATHIRTPPPISSPHSLMGYFRMQAWWFSPLGIVEHWFSECSLWLVCAAPSLNSFLPLPLRQDGSGHARGGLRVHLVVGLRIYFYLVLQLPRKVVVGDVFFILLVYGFSMVALSSCAVVDTFAWSKWTSFKGPWLAVRNRERKTMTKTN